MNKFSVVLGYELKQYFKDKGYLAITFIIAIVGAVALFLPRFIDLSGFTGVDKEGKVIEAEEGSNVTDPMNFAIYDKNGIIVKDILDAYYPDSTITKANSEEEVKELVENEEVEAGFVIESYNKYDYYVYNKGVFDANKELFNSALRAMSRYSYAATQGIDYAELEMVVNLPVEANDIVLGKDNEDNYWYSYMLVIFVFMLIIMYGQMIAVSVTNEKSNRSIEVLVTSTSPNSLLFGKVIAGAIAGLFQAGFILGAILISYGANRAVWGNVLDMILNIPANVLVAFAAFGLGGFLFYAFLYGAMGALVSKTEDVSKSSGGLMMIIMIVYFISLAQLTNVDGPIMKVLSFLPVSSYSAMFVRIAMGTVSMAEIIISFVILVISIFVAGIIGAKIYRMGTLRYGNPIKLTTALKDIRKKWNENKTLKN